MEVTRKQSTLTFPKTEYFLPPDTSTCACAYQGVRNICFSENLASFVSRYLHFEIRPFALLPTINIFKSANFKVIRLLFYH